MCNYKTPWSIILGEKDKVYKLKKAPSQLKHASRSWNSPINTYFTQSSFSKCAYEHVLYMKIITHGYFLFIYLYVDTIKFIGNNFSMIKEFKHSMK